MVKIMENPNEQIDDLGVFPLFLETPKTKHYKIQQQRLVASLVA